MNHKSISCCSRSIIDLSRSHFVKFDLAFAFEAIVTSPFEKSIVTPIGKLPVLTWLITLDENTCKIHLNAVTRSGLFSRASSYPFGSVTSAYRFMVRL